MLVFRESLGSQNTPPAVRLSHRSIAASQASPPQAPSLKVSVPTPFGWFYLNVRAGRERRSLDRLMDEGQVSPAKLSLVYTLAMWIAVGLIGLGGMVSIYLLKSFAGIDLLEGPSFLHDFLF